MDRFEEMGEILKAMAHPVRLQIVAGLKKDGCNVSEIQRNLELPQSTISQHLKVLKQAGIIHGKRDGTKVCYTVLSKWANKIVEMMDKG
jgi:DNA-binding transcriptional ArsR family regulator